MAAWVCVLRGRDACLWTRWTRWTKWTRWGRHVIPCWFALPQCGLARAKSYRWGDYCSSAPQIKPQYSQYSQYSQSAPPAGHSKPQRLFRILVQKLPLGKAARPKPTFLPKLLALFFEFYGPEKDAAGAEEHKGKYTHISILRINEFTVHIFRGKKIHDPADDIAENGDKDIGAEV